MRSREVQLGFALATFLFLLGYVSVSRLHLAMVVAPMHVQESQDIKEEPYIITVSSRRSVIYKTEEVQRQRYQHIRRVCNFLNVSEDTKGSNLSMKLIYSSENRLAIRLVPKIGSTFMIQVFSMLNKQETENIFNLSRVMVHKTHSSSSYKKIFTLAELHNYTVLLMARNPYSRLYSAYLDKVYLLDDMRLASDVFTATYGNRNNGTRCMFNTSFHDFLWYALDRSRYRLNFVHYNPLVNDEYVKKVCRLKHLLVIKQESFSSDLEYALKLSGLQEEKLNIIYEELHSQQAATTVAALVRTSYQKMEHRGPEDPLVQDFYGTCSGWKTLTRRMWKAFQYQGYIAKDSVFPEKKFPSDISYEDAEYFLSVVLEEIRTKPLSRAQKLEQRTEALKAAYNNVDEATKKQIKGTYAFDFLMFNYDPDV